MTIHWDAKPSKRLNPPLNPKDPIDILIEVGDYSTYPNISRLSEGDIYRVIISFPSQNDTEEYGGDYLYCRVNDDVYLWRDD